MKSRKIKIILIVATIPLMACLAIYLMFISGRNKYLMFTYIETFSDERDKITAFIDENKNNQHAIDMALEKYDFPGSKAEAWCCTLLLRSDSLEYVKMGLEAIGRDSRETRGRRICAYDILYAKTKDSKYMLDLYDLVKEPGGIEVYAGRKSLVYSYTIL
ncbi:MAG: hypothetical protein HZA50_12815 [Planctomycetes bacterium]|nr:hypothetical protein [Planctomycetota bacterium]